MGQTSTLISDVQSTGDTADGQEVWRSDKGEEKNKMEKMASLFTFK